MRGLRSGTADRPGHFAASIAIFVGLFAVYLLNGAYLLTGDAVSNVYTTVSLLHDDDFDFDSFEAPMIFEWQIVHENRTAPVHLTQVDSRIVKLIEAGKLQVARHNLSISTPSVQPGRYVSAFSPGAAIVALPFYAFVESWTGDVRKRPAYLWYSGKVVAALCTAGAAIFVFWTVLLLGEVWQAWVCALVYGLGTAAWTTASQGLFQHGPNEMFLALGVYFLVRSEFHPRSAAWCGLALAAATCCRPTGAIAVAAVGAYLLAIDRRRLLAFALAGIPLAVLLGWYNATHLGSPFTFGQTSLHELAMEKTGLPEVFSTPIWYGLAGLLFSPSRGMFIFSPILLFSVAGLVQVWRDRLFVVLRPVSATVVAILLVESKHFDWWSGWSYGYRHLADLTPLLVVLMVPVLAAVRRHRAAWYAFFLAALASVWIQLVGAFFYDAMGWNQRRQYRVVSGSPPAERTTLNVEEAKRWARETGGRIEIEDQDIDRPEYRHRLWSLVDSEIVYYSTEMARRREQQRKMSDFFVQPLDSQRADDYARIASAFENVGDQESASRWRRLSEEVRAHPDLFRE